MRSMLSGFPTEKVKIIKKDLTVIEDVEALVDRDNYFRKELKMDYNENELNTGIPQI